MEKKHGIKKIRKNTLKRPSSDSLQIDRYLIRHGKNSKCFQFLDGYENKFLLPSKTIIETASMSDKNKTKDQLIEELEILRSKIASLGSNLSKLESTKENMELYQAHLEEMTNIRTSELMEALDKAEKANVIKDTFLANLSHELHTPIHQINSYSDLGVKKLTRAIETEAAVPETKLLQYFQNIYSASESLFAFTTSLLNLMKLETGEIQYCFRKYSILEVLDAEQRKAVSTYPEKNVVIDIRNPEVCTTVEIDLQWIHEVFKNIFSNSIKFSPPNSRITVTFNHNQVNLFEKNHDALQINIIDQGIGIPESELDYIFEKFTQSSRTADGSGGKGIGLAICRKIINDHNGRIHAENNAEGGATFCITLLYNQPEGVPETRVLKGFESC